MDDRHIAEHFVVAGLPLENPEPLEEFSCDGAALKTDHSLPPITDIAVVNTSLGEEVPDGYTIISQTPSGGSANLNLGVFRAPEMFLCFRRGTHQLPLVDIGVYYPGRERVLPDSQVVEFTVPLASSHSANVNPSGHTTFMTYRRANPDAECNELVVSDICVKNREMAPHSYCTIEKNLNKGTVMGTEVNVCYRKSVNRCNYIAYKPGLLDQRSPVGRKASFSLPSDLALFCVPMGATLESWPRNTLIPGPVFSTFVLTVTSPQSEQVDKVYCAGLTFYERYDHSKLTLEQASQLQLDNHCGVHNLVYTNKSICILSLWPFFDTFEVFLKYLHKMAYSGPHTVPIERFVHHLLETVPFPSPRRPRILVQLDPHTKISLTQPEESPLALSGAKFRELVHSLRPAGCIQVLVFALTEQKLLLHSLRPAVLTAAAEALTMIIFPFHWQCPYVPLCPLGLSSFLNAPIPFLLGLDSRFFDIYHPPQDVICVDLDTGAISIPEDKKSLNEKMLPRRCLKLLRTTLETLCVKMGDLDRYREKCIRRRINSPDESHVDTDFRIKKMEQELEVEIQEAFLTFTAGLLNGYSSFLQPIVSKNTSPDTSTLFDVDGFVKSRERSYQKFFHLLVNTQIFSKFIEERSFVSDKDASLAFFDECVERVAAASQGGGSGEPLERLLEVETGTSEHTSLVPPPEPPPNVPPGTTWTYQGFPVLDKSLFCPPSPHRPMPRLLPPIAGGGVGGQHPPSPMARRSKQEVRSAQKQAVKQALTPLTWAKCLVSTAYSVWFIQLSSFALTQQHRGRVLQLAYKVLLHIQKLAQHNTDEVSYRIMMQLCGVYSQPVLAVQVLCAMTSLGISPNAITYGYYNRAVLENKWTHSNLYWNKLRNVVSGVAAFRSSGRDRAMKRRLATSHQGTPQYPQRAAAGLQLQKKLGPPQQGKNSATGATPADEIDSLSIDGDSCSRVSIESEDASVEGGVGGSSSTTPARVSVLSSSTGGGTRRGQQHAKTDTLGSDPGYCSISEQGDTGTVMTLADGSNDAATAHIISNTADAPENIDSGGIAAHEEAASVAERVADDGNKTAILESAAEPNGVKGPPPFETKTFNEILTVGSSNTTIRSSTSNKSSSVKFNNSRRNIATSTSISKSNSSGSITADPPLACVMASTTLPVVHAAGLVMTSPLDDAVFEPSQRHRSRPTDLAHALTPTLHNYDQMSDTSVPRTSEASGNIPEYLRNANMGGDGRIINRLWSFASSYIPYSADSNFNSPASSVSNTPRRQPQRNGPGERWERSVERWENSPKVVARDRERRSLAAAKAAATASQKNVTAAAHRDTSASRLSQHARSDSGSSADSGDVAAEETLAANAIKLSGSIGEDSLGSKLFDDQEKDETLSVEVSVPKPKLARPQMKNQVPAKSKDYFSDAPADGHCEKLPDAGASKSPSEEILSDIAEEEHPIQAGGALGKSFFTRNAPERLSSLIKRGVGGADEKIRGFWKKGVSRSGSKDSMGSMSSGGDSIATSPSVERMVSPASSDGCSTEAVGSGSNTDHQVGVHGKQATLPSGKEGLPRMRQNTMDSNHEAGLTKTSTDQKLFRMKEQPRLFQHDSPDEFKTPPTSPLKKSYKAKARGNFASSEPVTIPVCPGRDQVILGDPLGALDSPEISPSSSPHEPDLPFATVPSSPSHTPSTCAEDNLVNPKAYSPTSEFAVPCETLVETSDYSRRSLIFDLPEEDMSIVIKRDLNLKVSTVKRTLLTPLPSQTISPEESPLRPSSSEITGVSLLNSHGDQTRPSTDMKTNESMLSAGQRGPSATALPQSVSSPSSLSSSSTVGTQSSAPTPISWSIAPIGSPFSAPIPIPITPRASTLPGLAYKDQQRSSSSPAPCPKTLPPMVPKTPNRPPSSSGGVATGARQSRSTLKNQQRRSPGGRSSSANTTTDDLFDDENVAVSSSSQNTAPIAGRVRGGVRRNANSLTSLTSAITDSDDPSVGGRRRGSDLAPRHAATLESNYSPSATWSQKWISDPSQQLNGTAALSVLANSGLQKLDTFRANYLDPTMAELLGGGSLSGARRGELLSGVKSAMSSFSKKFRQSISANTTPTRGPIYGEENSSPPPPGFFDIWWRSLEGGGGGDDEDSTDGGLFSWSRRESTAQDHAATHLTVGALTGSDELLQSHALSANLAFLSGSGAPYGNTGHTVTLGGYYGNSAGQSGGDAMYNSATGQLFEMFSAGSSWEAQGPYCLGVGITSCSKCHNCRTLLYDEEIMAGWSADDSNLNTKCRYCERFTVPVLTITLYDMLHLSRHEAPGVENERRKSTSVPPDELGSRSNQTNQTTSAPPTKEDIYKTIRSKVRGREPLTVAYLSPLVLRKELESMLSHEGDEALTFSSCPEKHPILYWNMMWYFTRLGLPSQLSGLCLSATLSANLDRLHPSWRRNVPGHLPKQGVSAATLAQHDPSVSSARDHTNNESNDSAAKQVLMLDVQTPELSVTVPPQETSSTPELSVAVPTQGTPSTPELSVAVPPQVPYVSLAGGCSDAFKAESNQGLHSVRTSSLPPSVCVSGKQNPYSTTVTNICSEDDEADRLFSSPMNTSQISCESSCSKDINSISRRNSISHAPENSCSVADENKQSCDAVVQTNDGYDDRPALESRPDNCKCGHKECAGVNCSGKHSDAPRGFFLESSSSSDPNEESSKKTEKAISSSDSTSAQLEECKWINEGTLDKEQGSKTTASATASVRVCNLDWRNVFVICLWDNPLFHQEVGPPLYVQMRERGRGSALVRAMVNQPLLINENILQSLLTCLHFDYLDTAMKIFAQELRKRPARLQQHRLPLYRDLLLLASDGLPRTALNMVSFEQKYRAAYDNLDSSIAGLLTPADSAPPLAANFAKRCFPPLAL